MKTAHYVKPVQIAGIVKTPNAYYISIGENKMDKNDIDASAEREGAALKKQGQYTQSKYQYIRQQTENYNKRQFNKLFRSK